MDIKVRSLTKDYVGLKRSMIDAYGDEEEYWKTCH